MTQRKENELKSYLQFIDDNDLDVETIDEGKLGRPNWIRALAAAAAIKISNTAKRVKGENDTNKKIDLLSEQIRLASFLSAASIAVDLDDRSLVGRIKMLGRR